MSNVNTQSGLVDSWSYDLSVMVHSDSKCHIEQSLFSNIDCHHGATIVTSYCTIVTFYCTNGSIFFARNVTQVIPWYLTSQYDVTIVAPCPRLDLGMLVHYKG